MSDKTVKIIITTSSFGFSEGDKHNAILDDDGFLVTINGSEYFISDGEAEVISEGV